MESITPRLNQHLPLTHIPQIKLNRLLNLLKLELLRHNSLQPIIDARSNFVEDWQQG